MDAFISWTGRDRDVKNVLVEKLRAEGISCWDSEEYCVSDYSQECINAIKRCGVFIVIVSEASMQKGYVKNEIIAARKQEEAGLLNMLVYKITDHPYTDDFEFQLNHISFLTGNLVQRRENLLGDTGIDTLVTRAKRLLQQRKDGEPEKPFRVKLPRVAGWQLTGSTGYFVENSRNQILDAIDAAFADGNALVLTEFVGFGKRSVVRKYLSTHPTRFTSAVMVDNQWGSLRNFLLSGLQFSNLNPALFENLQGDALIDAKLRQLEKLDQDTLLVIPDLDLPEDRDLYRRLLSLRCRIILLTQGSAESCYDLLPVIRVGKMEDPYLTELFFHYYNRAFEEEKEQLAAPLEDFFDQIGGHTKTVELTASVLNRDLGILPSQLGSFLSFRGTEGMELKDRILGQLSQLFVMEQLTPGQVKALVIAACLAVPYLSEQHFRQLLRECGVDNWQEITELDSRRWLDLDPKNRTVSIEPLVAQIVLQRFPEEQEVLLLCLRYLNDAYLRQFGVIDSVGFLTANLARLEHFFHLTNLDVLAELPEALRLSLLSNENKEALSAAAERFGQAYPEAEFSVDPECVEWSDLSAELIYDAQYFVRCNLLPLVKMQSSLFGNLWSDYSGGSRRILEKLPAQTLDMPIDMELLFGMDRETFVQWLESLRQSIPEDTEGTELRFVAEVIAAQDAMLRRDSQNTLLSMENLLIHLQESPNLLCDEYLADLFFSCAVMLANIYITSKAYTSAVRLCEKILAYPTTSPRQVLLKKLYISALQEADQYNEILYRVYEQLLRDMDEFGGQIFENHRELLQEKQRWTLWYAESLVVSGNCRQAMEQFACACKGELLLPNEAVETAWTISEGLVRSGEFETALEFLGQFFPPEKQVLLAPLCDKEHQELLAQINDLLTIDARAQTDFQADDDPERHISYYHEYSRKNNSLLDRKYCAVADRAMEFDFQDLTDEELTAYARKLRSRSARENLLRLAPEAFALASEAGFRVLGYRHHYVQYMGAAAMADGKIAEILNGEGKTYTIVATAFLQWLFGKKIYVVDESPNLTQRNHNWMRGVYQLLGMESKCILNYRTMKDTPADVYYITLEQMVFAYLSYEQSSYLSQPRLKLDVAIIDEIDMVLVDEAKRRFDTVRPEADPEALPLHQKAWKLAETLDFYAKDFSIRGNQVSLLPGIYPKMEQVFGIQWDDLEQLPRIQKIESLVRSAIMCRFGYEENKDYFIHKGQPVWEDQARGVFTSFGTTLEYFLCLHNNLDTAQSQKALQYRNRVSNSICVQALFRKFHTVCGTTATAVSFRKEFKEIYDLEYVAVPPHSPVIRTDTQSPLYVSTRYKDQAILELLVDRYNRGQPVLLITQSIAESEKYHKLLKRYEIPHSLLNAKNADEAADILSTAGLPGSVLVANALVSRGADIRLGGNPERQTLHTLVEMGVDISGLEDFLYRLPTPEQKESELYKKYYSILEQKKRLSARLHQEVVAAGGLCVIGTSFFSEPRNEQQTRGRCGRQGTVGESRVFRSMDDPGLKELLSTAYVEMLLASIEGVEEINSPILSAALKKAQKDLHNAYFADIRHVNNSTRHIEKYRDTFLGLRKDLVTAKELLAQWAADKTVHKQLQLLQQGQSRCENMVLNHLWKQDESLQNAKGLHVQRMLEAACLKIVDRHFAFLAEDIRTKILNSGLCNHLQTAWEDYLEIVWDATKALNAAALDKFLEQEKNRLMRQAVESLLWTCLYKRLKNSLP